MTRIPLRHIVISSFLLALTGCATNLGDRVDTLEQRVGELEQNSQTQRVVMDARFDAINHEFAGNKLQADTSPAKGKKPSAPKAIVQDKAPVAAPRYIDPGPSLAKVAANPSAPGNTMETTPKPHDPVQEALSSAKGQPVKEPSQPGKSESLVQPALKEQSGGYVGNANPQAVSKETPQAKAPAKSGPESAYKSALNLLESGKPAVAKQAFEKFIAEYPNSNLTPNAYYWLGESSYTLKQYDQAILTFKDVPNKYPKHPKAAAAMLKTAFAYLKLGDKDNARFYLQTLLEQYPGSEPSGLAKKQLSSL